MLSDLLNRTGKRLLSVGSRQSRQVSAIASKRTSGLEHNHTLYERDLTLSVLHVAEKKPNVSS